MGARIGCLCKCDVATECKCHAPVTRVGYRVSKMIRAPLLGLEKDNAPVRLTSPGDYARRADLGESHWITAGIAATCCTHTTDLPEQRCPCCVPSACEWTHQ